MHQIYLDYASTTPVDPEVKAAMEPYFSDKFGNAGAAHRWGQEAQGATDEARRQVAEFFGCAFDEVIFTGSATESDNFAIRGVFKYAKKAGVQNPHIITTQIEHKAVLATCEELEGEGVEVDYIPVSKEGMVEAKDIKERIKENTVLISVMYVNNEIGTIQPINEIASIVREHRGSKQFPILHTDAVQAVNYLDCDVKNLGVDLLTFSGHKIYGPKGIGGLYVKRGTGISPVITGGGQEQGLRGGTENVPAIVGIAKAFELVAKSRESETKRLSELRDYFIDEVLKGVSGAELNGSRERRVANNANILFRGISANDILMMLDQKNAGVSSGSACNIKLAKPSYVILALGRNEEEASQSIRFTLGRSTTKEDIDFTISALRNILSRTGLDKT